MKFKPNHYIIGGKKLPENKFLDLKRDIVFQRLFGSQKNAAITGHLLSLILKRDISNLDLDVNKRMMGKNINIKVGRLDIRAKFNNGEECNIEMQVAPYDFMPQRMLDYWADMYANKIKIGQDYGVLKPTISILIANYKIKELKEIPKYHTKWALKEEDYKDIVLIKDLEFHILEIPKVLKNQTLKNDELAIWLKFIENP